MPWLHSLVAVERWEAAPKDSDRTRTGTVSPAGTYAAGFFGQCPKSRTLPLDLGQLGGMYREGCNKVFSLKFSEAFLLKEDSHEHM